MSLPTNSIVRGVSLAGYRLLGRRPYKRGLFPLSGDPVHFGHIETIMQALTFCDEVVVLLLFNDEKNPTLTPATRQAGAEIALRGFAENYRVTLDTSQGLMADEFLARGCDVLIRGVRDARDAVYERAYVNAQRDLFPWFKNVPVEILEARGLFRTISSSLLKTAVRNFVAIDRFVPVITQQLLQEILVGQHLVGVTGTIASGKTTVVKHLISTLREHNVRAYSIAIDEIVRDVYGDPCAGCAEIRQKLRERFGSRVLTVDETNVDRAYLKEKLFGSSKADENRRWVERITMAQVRRIYREKLRVIREKDAPSIRQLIFLEWAQPVSSGLARWSNNNVIVIGAPDAERLRAAEERGISAERLIATRKVQGSTMSLIRSLRERVAKDDLGTVFSFTNRWLASAEQVKANHDLLFAHIFELFPQLKKV